MVKKKFTLALFPLALCFSSAHVLAAATVADLEQRIAEQEKQILRLNNTLKGTRAAVKEDRSRIQEMQERLKINGFFSAGAATMDDDDVYEPTYRIEDNLHFDPVSKLGVQMTFQVSDDVDITAQLVSKGTRDYDTEAEWMYLSYDVMNDLTLRFGRQRIPYYLLSEYLDVGFALPWVRPPLEMYNVPVQAFDGVSALYSLAIGDVNLTFQPYTGSSYGYTDQLEGEFEINQQYGMATFAEYGDLTVRLGFSTSHVDVRNVDEGGTGASLFAGLDGVGTFANTINTIASSNPALNRFMVAEPAGDSAIRSENVRTVYTSAGFSYDDGQFLVMGEVSNLRVMDYLQPGGDGGYLTFGYHFGKWMPHVTFAKFYTDSAADEYVRDHLDYINSVEVNAFGLGATLTGLGSPSGAAITNAATTNAAGLAQLHNGLAGLISQQQSYTLGLVYEINPRVKAKLEASHYENFGDYELVTGYSSSGYSSVTAEGDGRFTRVVDPIDDLLGNSQFNLEGTGNHTAIYSFSIDAVF